MKYDYEKRYKHILKLSDRQLEQLSAHYLMMLFMENNTLEDLPNINPEWINAWKKKEFPFWCSDELEKNGVVDLGIFRIRKAKKGYVLEAKFNWRSKGISTIQYPCRRCKKLKSLNWHSFCESCTKKLGGSKGIAKWNDKELREMISKKKEK